MIFSVFVIKVFDYRCITCIYALNKKVLKHNFLNVCMKETWIKKHVTYCFPL